MEYAVEYYSSSIPNVDIPVTTWFQRVLGMRAITGWRLHSWQLSQRSRDIGRIVHEDTIVAVFQRESDDQAKEDH